MPAPTYPAAVPTCHRVPSADDPRQQREQQALFGAICITDVTARPSVRSDRPQASTRRPRCVWVRGVVSNTSDARTGVSVLIRSVTDRRRRHGRDSSKDRLTDPGRSGNYDGRGRNDRRGSDQGARARDGRTRRHGRHAAELLPGRRGVRPERRAAPLVPAPAGRRGPVRRGRATGRGGRLRGHRGRHGRARGSRSSASGSPTLQDAAGPGLGPPLAARRLRHPRGAPRRPGRRSATGCSPSAVPPSTTGCTCRPTAGRRTRSARPTGST